MQPITATAASTAPLVSVYVPTRNRATLLPRALQSVWRQQREDIELIVVDDASTDGTPALLERLAAANRLRWIRNDRPVGACAARNQAIAAASGRFVAGLDDDDEMLPGRISKLLGLLRPSDAFACASDWIVAPGRLPGLRIVPRIIGQQAILSRNVVGNQVLAERSKVLACGGFDESLPSAQDYDLWIRMIMRHGPARGSWHPLQVVHAGHSDARISGSPARRHGYWLVYRKHRSVMQPACRRAHLYNLLRANGHRTRLPADLRFWTTRNRLRMVWHAMTDPWRRPATPAPDGGP